MTETAATSVDVDDDLEFRINHAALSLATATERVQRVFWFEALTRLVKKRSVERVEEMEDRKGLR